MTNDAIAPILRAGSGKVLGVDHVAIAVPEIEPALKVWRDLLGWNLVHVERVDEQGADTARLEIGPHCVELVAPIGPDSPIGKFLAKRGPGLHHVCLKTNDVAGLLADLEKAGVELIDKTPKKGAHDCLIAFVHPRATGGVLVELSEKRA
jgi:methylmalonyl-CoA/ethylmalonyl-CoA epimerase